jgi:hypothetical protein
MSSSLPEWVRGVKLFDTYSIGYLIKKYVRDVVGPDAKLNLNNYKIIVFDYGHMNSNLQYVDPDTIISIGMVPKTIGLIWDQKSSHTKQVNFYVMPDYPDKNAYRFTQLVTIPVVTDPKTLKESILKQIELSADKIQMIIDNQLISSRNHLICTKKLTDVYIRPSD